MSAKSKWNIESYRTAYESEEHWALKRDFMKAHKKRIPQDRLVCLAQVFANIEVLGCKYPDKTMEEVSILARDVGEDYKEKKKTKLQRTFVKASDAAGAKVKGTIAKRKNEEQQQQNKPLKKKPMRFVKASGTEEADNETATIGNQDSKAIKTKPNLPSVVSEKQFGVEKYKKAPMPNTKKAVTSDNREDESAINPTSRRIGIGNGRSGTGNTTSGSSSPQITPVTVNNSPAVWDDSDPLSEFVIVQREYHAYRTAFSILSESSVFSQIPVAFDWTQKGAECTVTLNGVNMATGRGETKKLSREAASNKVLEILSQRCYTLKVLKPHTAEEEVSVGEVSDGTKSDQSPSSRPGTSLDKPIEDTSMGSKLLKMMGWTGGGLGKEGTGITEPIRPPEVCGRGGFGHSQKKGGSNLRFRKRIIAIVRDFTQNSELEDLAFSPDFTKEQRAEIHKIARRFKLKSTSHGTGDTRYLVLSHKFSAKQLICTLCKEGPTDKYELIPPKA
ncbi:uncharacterized protein [Panulirus ornatus]|uniref:uncharacterized protein n=1 Tax=Panulirus ornatus TaxID=150431 RepID=UPI003A874962